MSEIQNYKTKGTPKFGDLFLGINMENVSPEMAVEDTVLFPFESTFSAFKNIIAVDKVKVSEITSTSSSSISTIANSLNPVVLVGYFELLYFNVNGTVYLLKKSDVAIGNPLGLNPTGAIITPLVDSDFMIVGRKGDAGTNGRGVVSTAKTGTVGLVDTYTTTYTDNTTSTFTITNGANGINGTNGVSVVSITKTGTTGLVDTYTITYSNSTTSTFTITNGANGTSIVSSGTTTTVSGDGSVGNPFKVEVNNLRKVVSANYTLQNADSDYTIYLNNSTTAITITVPSGLELGFNCGFKQLGSADITFAGAGGVSITNPTGLKVKGRNYNVYLEQFNVSSPNTISNIYYLDGDTKA